jgi:hypothetical protein
MLGLGGGDGGEMDVGGGNLGSDPDFDWAVRTGQRRPPVAGARDVGQERHTSKQLLQQKSQQQQQRFNPERLLHPWQRELENMKKSKGQPSVPVGGVAEVEDQPPLGHGFAAAKNPRLLVGMKKKGSVAAKKAKDSLARTRDLPPLDLQQGSIVSQLTMDMADHLQQPSLSSLDLVGDGDGYSVSNGWRLMAGNNSSMQRSATTGTLSPMRPDMKPTAVLQQLARLSKGTSGQSKAMRTSANEFGVGNADNASVVSASSKRSVSFHPSATIERISSSESPSQQQAPSPSASVRSIGSYFGHKDNQSINFAKYIPKPKQKKSRDRGDSDEDDDDDDDDDEAIGWSPFVVPSATA